MAKWKRNTRGAFLEGLGDSHFHEIKDFKGAADLLCKPAAAANLAPDTKGKENCPKNPKTLIF